MSKPMPRYESKIIVPVHEREVRDANARACLRNGPAPYPTTSLRKIERGAIVIASPARQAHELLMLYAAVGRIYEANPDLSISIESITAEALVASYTVRLWADCWSLREAEAVGDLLASALVLERGGHNGIVILGDSPRKEYKVGALWVDAPF